MRTEFSYQSSNGLNHIKAYVWTPEEGIPLRGIVSVLHGMAEHALRYEELALFLNRRGYMVVGNDHLGHGRSANHEEDLGYWGPGDAAENAIRDIDMLRRRYQKAYPGLPFFMLGHSMGSMLLRYYLSEYGEGLNGAIIIGTPDTAANMATAGALLARLIRIFRGERHHSKLLATMSVKDPLARIPEAKTEFDWLSLNEENINRYIADPYCGFPFTVNGHLALFRIAARMNRLGGRSSLCPKNLPLLFLTGALDPISSYASGMQAVADRLRTIGFSEIKTRVYPHVRHEILNDESRSNVMQDILNFLEEHQSRVD